MAGVAGAAGVDGVAGVAGCGREDGEHSSPRTAGEPRRAVLQRPPGWGVILTGRPLSPGAEGSIFTAVAPRPAPAHPGLVVTNANRSNQPQRQRPERRVLFRAAMLAQHNPSPPFSSPSFRVSYNVIRPLRPAGRPAGRPRDPRQAGCIWGASEPEAARPTRYPLAVGPGRGPRHD